MAFFSFSITWSLPLKVLGGIIMETSSQLLYLYQNWRRHHSKYVNILSNFLQLISLSVSLHGPETFQAKRPPSISVHIWAWMSSLTFKVLFQILAANEWKSFRLACFVENAWRVFKGDFDCQQNFRRSASQIEFWKNTSQQPFFQLSVTGCHYT